VPIVFTLCACQATAPGDAGPPAPTRTEVAVFVLNGVGHARGEVGQAVLVPKGESTSIDVSVSSVPDDVTRPVHLYTFIHRGTCEHMDATIAYDANRQVLAISGHANSGMFQVRNTASVSLTELRASAHAIVIRSAPADGNLTMYCGDIR
jgi:hypothetical protein